MKKLTLLLLLIIPIIATAQLKHGAYYYRMTEPVSNTMSGLDFSDEIIKVHFVIAHNFIEMEIMNLSQGEVTVVWDDGVVVANGRSDKLAIIGIRNAMNLPEIKLLKGTSTGKCKVTQRMRHRGNGSNAIFTKHETIYRDGLPLMVVVPILINGVEKEYEFNLIVKNASKAPDYFGMLEHNIDRTTAELEKQWDVLHPQIEEILQSGDAKRLFKELNSRLPEIMRRLQSRGTEKELSSLIHEYYLLHK
jgi:hypothetical protein